MKNVLTILLGIACVTVLIYGHFHWNQRIDAASAKSPNLTTKETTTQSDKKQESSKPSKDLLNYTSNWPKAAVERWKHTQEEKQPFKILFTGSPAIGTDTTGTYAIVKDKLLATFGENNLQVAIKTFNSTSTQVIANKKQDEIAAEEADLIILEPFILMNNGNVLMQNTVKDIKTMIDDIKAKNPDAVILLQPSYPLYKAKIYPSQVDQLKQFAELQKLTYLDHWTAWPDANTEEIKEYVTPDQSAPSEKGNQVWSEYLLHYLIHE
ncbi:SGNH/GDSL hydrolase family protein [Bacillus sp. 1P10SD]|uniref:SGNH/GDSL hydrolase family protein n=1 Tax=Bacillus sp. 1P10SD TaxID=3132265 RepID=UPI0039A5EA59